MPAPNTSKAPVPSINEERRSVVIFMCETERHRFKQHAAVMNRTMSDLAREKFQEYHNLNPAMDKNILPPYKASSPPPISETRKNLSVFMSVNEHCQFRMLATTIGRPMSDLARDLVTPYICNDPEMQV